LVVLFIESRIMESEIREIIVRVLGGEASLNDKQKLISWLGQDQENIKAFGQAESIWNALEIMATGKEFDSDKAFDKFKEKIPGRQSLADRSKLMRSIDWIIRIAAVVVIITGLAFLIFRRSPEHVKTDTSICEIVAPKGSKAQLILPDGTKVWLNAFSKISYQKDYNEVLREVYLEGEGYFEVAKNRRKPFLVNTADIRIRALGTSFNVKSYPSENTIETTLIEGRIALEKVGKENKIERMLIMKPNQKVTYYKNPEKPGKDLSVDQSSAKKVIPIKPIESQIVLNDKVNSELSTAWKNNRLYFENESFEDLAVKLERRFGVKFHFLEGEIQQYPFSGVFDEIIIEQVLAALQYASPFYYMIHDTNIYISNKPIRDIPKTPIRKE
jgi:transmembrane sensor